MHALTVTVASTCHPVAWTLVPCASTCSGVCEYWQAPASLGCSPGCPNSGNALCRWVTALAPFFAHFDRWLCVSWRETEHGFKHQVNGGTVTITARTKADSGRPDAAAVLYGPHHPGWLQGPKKLCWSLGFLLNSAASKLFQTIWIINIKVFSEMSPIFFSVKHKKPYISTISCYYRKISLRPKS